MNADFNVIAAEIVYDDHVNVRAVVGLIVMTIDPTYPHHVPMFEYRVHLGDPLPKELGDARNIQRLALHEWMQKCFVSRKAFELMLRMECEVTDVWSLGQRRYELMAHPPGRPVELELVRAELLPAVPEKALEPREVDPTASPATQHDQATEQLLASLPTYEEAVELGCVDPKQVGRNQWRSMYPEQRASIVIDFLSSTLEDIRAVAMTNRQEGGGK